MKKWFRFFSLSFFSDKAAKEGAKRGYTNFFLALILAFAFLWVGYIGADMLPFSMQYNRSHDFVATVHTLLANPDAQKRIDVEIEDGILKAKKYGGEYREALLVNSFENQSDRQDYSVNGYNVVIDSRPADALAEVEAYCVSNDGQNIVISYQEYLSLSAVAKMNFDFKLKYTGNELELSDETVESYRAYLVELNEEQRQSVDKLDGQLREEKITKLEYNREIYKLYFTNYYPEITNYESSSNVPLLRNYYYHQYIRNGESKYLFIFDDYLAASFETRGGNVVSFYGFYSNLADGSLIAEGAGQEVASKAADSFIKDCFNAMLPINAYAYAMNIFSFIPFIALMPMVVALLAYSILKLRGIESITSFGGVFKIIGSFAWFSAFASALLTVMLSFFVKRSLLAMLPLVLFFISLAVRSIIFAVNEAKSYTKQLEQEELANTEV